MINTWLFTLIFFPMKRATTSPDSWCIYLQYFCSISYIFVDFMRLNLSGCGDIFSAKNSFYISRLNGTHHSIQLLPKIYLMFWIYPRSCRFS